MPSIKGDNEEKKRIRKWAAQHEGESDLLTYNPNKEDRSYFTSFDNSANCVEYGFDNVPQLRKKLDGLWTSDPVMLEVLLPVCVAVFKGRPQKKESLLATEQKTNDKTEEVTIPEFVYAF